MLRESSGVVLVTFGPLGLASYERQDSEFSCEVGGGVGDAAGDESDRHGGRHPDALEGVTLLELGARSSELAATSALMRGPSSRLAGPIAVEAR
jgi:hypothetical protein